MIIVTLKVGLDCRVTVQGRQFGLVLKTATNVKHAPRCTEAARCDVLEEVIQAMESAFVSRRVNAVSAEETELARLRAGNREEVGDAVILPEVIGMQPVSAVVRARDLNWLTLVNATISLLIDAESLGITSDNVERMKAGNDPEIQYVLGVTPGIGIVVGLDDRWGERVIKSVGNYGQMFRRDLGADSPLAIPRGLNELWSRGGLLYSQPLR
jgi:general L-amino acid transport system substrate-binding protein